ncbi:MAG: ATP-binding protein [Saprospiraceae bacterium]|nr:ATP-binding protein [Saprospiraceae bacterium]
MLHLSTKFPEEICLSNTNAEQETFSKDVVFDNIIGYEDFKSILLDQLNPIVNGKTLDLWGLRPPGGIILFGPPGCGKTFWAEEIAKYLQFQFLEIPRSIFASSFVDGAVIKLKELLDSVEPKQ